MFSKKTIYTYLIGFGVLMVVFAFTDLAISKALFNIESPFGRFFESFGEVPSSLTGALACGILLFNIKSTGGKGVAIRIPVALGLVFGAFSSGMFTTMYLLENFLPVAICVMLVVVGASIFAGIRVKRLSPEKREAFRRVAIVGAWLFFLAVLVINIIKPLWGRVRFREMAEPFENYTRWFFPQLFKFRGVVEDPGSFPSGHTANAAVIFIITLFPLLFDKLKDKKVLLTVIAAVWTILVALSRIVMGAHFASDVLMGATVSLCIFMLLCRKCKVSELKQ